MILSHQQQGSNHGITWLENKALKKRRTTKFWKLAHQLLDPSDHQFFMTLNQKGIEFQDNEEFVAFKKGKTVGYVDQWYPASKTCNHCKHALESLPLDVERWHCPSC